MKQQTLAVTVLPIVTGVLPSVNIVPKNLTTAQTTTYVITLGLRQPQAHSRRSDSHCVLF